MNAQPDLFGSRTLVLPPIARRTDPVTSHRAAKEHTDSGKRQTNMERVVAGVHKAPGRTSRELAAYLGMDYHEVARRLPDAENKGLVRKGEPRTCHENARAACSWWPVYR